MDRRWSCPGFQEEGSTRCSSNSQDPQLLGTRGARGIDIQSGQECCNYKVEAVFSTALSMDVNDAFHMMPKWYNTRTRPNENMARSVMASGARAASAPSIALEKREGLERAQPLRL